eukprot:CAMPEP_0182586018 /NCGR_PEP_ID=MMETSP1324-20130603/61651_1 /TAXON_ID=236786 /ORGANISM="Florenciella sp., Strain RCC1587" /LENGTH=78 /DNA_ID=CAMNT_0024802861 /DNA_START=23 /DNA_END=255 /DNA_ORIENTATION=+
MTNINGTVIASTLISTSSSTSGWDVSLVYWMRSVGDTRMVYVLIFAVACIIRSVLNPDLCTAFKFGAVKQMLTPADQG